MAQAIEFASKAKPRREARAFAFAT